MSRSRAFAAVVALALAGCGNGKVNSRVDAFVERPVIDPAPYYTVCNAGTPCPAPYECAVADLAHDPVDDVCLVPCTNSSQCPVDNACNGSDVQVEMGASNHCIVVP